MRPDWHRYMIVIAAAQGFTVTEIPVPLYPRHAGRSKFGLWRIPVGVLDMLAVWFELRFGQKPLLAFGMVGACSSPSACSRGGSALVVLLITGVRTALGVDPHPDLPPARLDLLRHRAARRTGGPAACRVARSPTGAG